ncbi:MAG: peptidoglycan DD-metalloendopeptidase family protein [Gammaproteobacteria bacterium]|nr:peptidoglycan DD-metalloendopeptidase family protein [Gammaproteobacteria bacterium]
MSLFFLIILLAFSVEIFADNAAKNTANNNLTDRQKAKSEELDNLRNVIKNLQNKLNAARSSQGVLRNELRAHEKKIGSISNDLLQINNQLETQTQTLQEQQQKEQILQQQLSQHKNTLKQQLRAAYSIGQQDYLKLLLNQQNPATLGRTLSYYDYFIKVRSENVIEVKSKISEIEQLQIAIKQQTIKLESIQKSQSEEIHSLNNTKNQRKLVLTKLNKKIRSNSNKLKKMRGDEKRLERLLHALMQAMPDIPEQVETLINFGRQKGRLQWPVKGRIRTKYGSSRKTGKLKWQGVIINAKEGKEVRAISHGQIAFADWLQGYGLLVIIDHGDSFMSLYGFNQSLYRNPGDWIEAGETIATVGNSGGNTKPGLYFEIRRNGKPINPSLWCSDKTNKNSARR